MCVLVRECVCVCVCVFELLLFKAPNSLVLRRKWKIKAIIER